jgi:lysophospholipase L1-like esterase
LAATSISARRRAALVAVTAAVTALITLIAGELIIRTMSPRPTLSPRFKFSPQYGFVNFESSRMVHERAGQWRFVYSVNALGYRGQVLSVSNTYAKKNIVVLGDSYSFGMGVQDGEEYPNILATALKNEYGVINLGVGGSGLTQEIRRFYELGQLYQPSVVVLQFHTNDLEDNFMNLVTTVEAGRFQFRESTNQLNQLKKYLSNSIIQKSQIYNLFRDDFYQYFARRIERKRRDEFAAYAKTGAAAESGSAVEQKFHAELLELFAMDLKKRGIRLILIAVEHHLDRAPMVQSIVQELQTASLIQYVEVVKWLQDLGEYRSPEGHNWGKNAHLAIGNGLAQVIQSPPEG